MSRKSGLISLSERLLRIDKQVKSISTAAWESVLKIKIIPKNKESNYEYLSDADRIEEEPINSNHSVTLYTIAILIASSAVWAALSPIDQVVSGQGKMISVEQNIILQPQDTAEIKDVKVRIGQLVRKGQVLVVLDPTIPRADYLQAEGTYNGVLRSLQISIKEISTIEARIRALKDIEEMTEKLVAKSFQSRRTLIEQQEKRYELEQALLNARARQNDLQSQKNSLEQQLVKARRRNELIEIIAPRDGVVLELSSLTNGSVAKATEPLVTLVPVDASIMAEVLIDPANISEVAVGVKAKIKLDAFPFQRFGYLEGRVATVTPDAIQAKTKEGKSAYYVRIELDKTSGEQSLANKLIPGMTLIAELVTDRRTVLEYIFDPLIKVKMESLNEK